MPHGALANVSFRAKGVKAGISSASPAAVKGATDLCSHCGPAKQKHMEGEEMPPTAGRSALRLEAFRKLRCQTILEFVFNDTVAVFLFCCSFAVGMTNTLRVRELSCAVIRGHPSPIGMQTAPSLAALVTCRVNLPSG